MMHNMTHKVTHDITQSFQMQPPKEVKGLHYTKTFVAAFREWWQPGLSEMVNKAFFILHKYVHGMSTFIYTNVCVYNTHLQKKKYSQTNVAYIHK